MYEAHFGLRTPPFRLSPDAEFYFDSRGHHAALEALRAGLAERRGHLLVSGEIGAGKTLLTAAALGELAPEQDIVGRLVSTQLDGDGLLRAVLTAFSAERRRTDRGTDPILAVDAYLHRLVAEGRRAVLLIDEAQNLEPGAWQRLAELDARLTAPPGTLTICFAGQPELRSILAAPANAALHERLAVQCHLGPLGAMETGAYIAHRLDHAGWSGRPGFGADAIDRIHRWTGGVPRRINQLCNRLLLSAFLGGREQIDAALVDLTADELRAEIGEGALAPQPPAPPAARTAAPSGAAAVGTARAPGSRGAPDAAATPGATTTPASARHPGEPAAPEPAAAEVARAPAPLEPPSALGVAEADELAPPLNLNLLPVDDVAPVRPEAPPPPPRVRFPSFAPWPSLPNVPLAPPVLHDAVEPPDRGGLLCVAGGPADHVQAAALLRAFAARRDLPPARLVRVFANDALQLAGRLFRREDAERAHSLGVSVSGPTAERASELMARFDALLEKLRPAAVVVFDGDEVAACIGIVASRRGILLLRVGAGRRGAAPGGAATVTRKLSDQAADVLYTADAGASEQLQREGLLPGRMSMVGSVLADALRLVLEDASAAARDESAELAGTVAQVASERAGYGIVVIEGRAHLQDRRTFEAIVGLLAEASRDLALVWPMRESTREQLLHLRLDAVVDRARIVCLPQQPYPAFVRLMSEATAVFTDSWTVQQEATALEVPCLTIGQSLAHPLTVAEGSNTFVGLNRAAATRAVWNCVFAGGKRGNPPRLWDGHAAERIATHLAGYLTRVRAAGG